MDQQPTGQEHAPQPQPQPQAQPTFQQPARRPGRAGFWIAIIFGVLLLISAGLNMFFTAGFLAGFEKGGEYKAITDPDTTYSDPAAADTIAVIQISGLINSEDLETPFGKVFGQVSKFRGQLQMVKNDKSVRAVIIEVNSPGGEVTASDEIYHMIDGFKKANTDIPVIVFMKDYAASGGYYVSAPANRIVAMPTCTTGSIGVVMTYFNVRTGLEDKLGVKPFIFKSGEMKDAGSPFKKLNEKGELSDADMKCFEGLIDAAYTGFLKVVYDGRKSKTGWTGPNDDNLKKIADGSAYTAPQALANNLIDKIGYFEDAVKEAKDAAKITTAKVVRYEYVSPRRLFGLGGASTTKINTGINVETEAGSLPGIGAPKFMYYWEP
jgi:protease-4